MIIIPDIHGRTFWKSAVKGRETEEIVFLGDYVDPYSELEGLEPLDGFIALSEIVEFKKLHPDNVTLLLGNHYDHIYSASDAKSAYAILCSWLSFCDLSASFLCL